MNLPQNIQEQISCTEMVPSGMLTLVVVESEHLFYGILSDYTAFPSDFMLPGRQKGFLIPKFTHSLILCSLPPLLDNYIALK